MATALSTALPAAGGPAAGGPVAGLFPGQGSQTADMREAVADAAPALLSRCAELVGEDPFERVAESTRYAQPAIFCASVASWRRLQAVLDAGGLDHRWRPSILAGHSLGELAALVAAEAMDAETGLELAVRRGELMADAGERNDDGGLVALLGASEAECEELASAHGASLANDNAPGQLVLAGSRSRLRELVAAARERGLRAIPLDVAGAFHSQAMAGAVEPFRAALDRVEIRPLRTPVISCASGEQMTDVRAELAQAIVKPVRWRQTMLSLQRSGASEFVDLGPGKVLAGLVRRNLPQAHGIEAATLLGAVAGAGIAV